MSNAISSGQENAIIRPPPAMRKNPPPAGLHIPAARFFHILFSFLCIVINCVLNHFATKCDLFALAPLGLQLLCLFSTILNVPFKNLSTKHALCGVYPTRKHTIPLPTAGLPRSPHKCASLAVTESDNTAFSQSSALRPFSILEAYL